MVSPGLVSAQGMLGLVLVVVACQMASAHGSCDRGVAFAGLFNPPKLSGGSLLLRGLPVLRRGSTMPPATCSLSAADIRMDRKDGGADKISKPQGPARVGNPGTGGGVGGGEGEREKEKGGAGVAVLTKPPETEKVIFEYGSLQCRVLAARL